MTKILMVVGSQRRNGFNDQLAHTIAQRIGDRAEVSFLDYSELPLINQDIEFPTPDSVSALRKAFSDADGVWFVTPVYNGSFSPQAKNIIDWVSRAPELGGDRTSALSFGTKATFSSASGHHESGQAMLSNLAGVAEFTGMDVLKDNMFHHELTSEWATNEVVLSEEELTALDEQIVAFLNKIA
ncbi:NAD(P)H-dependent oxidoreductase [Alloscardovia theropitheci]|uniref:NAD(P)H-dependent oxidoreductase n=1 Tax=Alloscardovia theropitheci TaxID=2496842 RepID=A0A4R0QVK0_9BIFI|nr:NADPH-dependent FMN reductase [Alloscardovia theropitheci]TCD54237.1 NAD(P)H-dependent oxidoreductase [Alloscardovia theropitheci]